jgi:hypothetical protein
MLPEKGLSSEQHRWALRRPLPAKGTRHTQIELTLPVARPPPKGTDVVGHQGSGAESVCHNPLGSVGTAGDHCWAGLILDGWEPMGPPS